MAVRFVTKIIITQVLLIARMSDITGRNGKNQIIPVETQNLASQRVFSRILGLKKKAPHCGAFFEYDCIVPA
jgi:hypothetical protein